MSDLFSKNLPDSLADKPAPLPEQHLKKGAKSRYSAEDIELLEGLEPVRRRPGMYIGGTDENALHHLFSEIIDNAMDEALAGFARNIHCQLNDDFSVTVHDNGRGIPCEPHPRVPDKSALEVILTSLHSGGKFSGNAYEISGGLHGVGISVVNALSDRFLVTVTRDGKIHQLSCVRGTASHALRTRLADKSASSSGTEVTFHPDPEIFGTLQFNPARLYKMAQSKAYLHGGIRITWQCPAEAAKNASIPAQDKFHYPKGLVDYMEMLAKGREKLLNQDFSGDVKTENGERVQWVISWFRTGDNINESWCNAVPTIQGGYHETAMRQAILRGVRNYGELAGNKRAAQLTADDLISSCGLLVSVFIREPQFQGQTKEKLVSPEVGRIIDSAIRDYLDHWLTADPARADLLLYTALENMEDRLRRRAEKTLRKSPVQRLRLPGKLSDCSAQNSIGTELFIVEGDSAGGSAKQARMREFQAILPLRGKILNVASASVEKLAQNQELSDLILALGCQTGKDYREEDLRYEKIIIMTDADVDGAHIAALLMAFFYREIPELILGGHLYLALPPLYRISQGSKLFYAHDDAQRDKILQREFRHNQKPDISRFKGLGEMPPKQLKETTMNPASRNLMQVKIPDASAGEMAAATETKILVENLLGRNPEKRFAFICDNAAFASSLDV